MLNRRLARIRAMQGLYALENAKGANFLLAQDLIAESFAPDLNSMEKQDRNKLAGLVKLSQSLFEDEVKNRISPVDDSTPKDVKAVLAKAREFYKLKNRKDVEFHTIEVLLGAERAYDIYLYILNLLALLGAKSDSLLAKNRVLIALQNSKELEYQSAKRSVNLEEALPMVNKLYTEVVKVNPHVIHYAEIFNKTLEDDLAIVKYLVKNVILKHEIPGEYFEKLHLFWVEDKDILRTMVSHSFDRFIDDQEVDIEKLDHQWEETKDFLRKLFKDTVANEEEYLGYILPHLKNWDLDRMIATDLILLKMAIAELINFPSIPVKVTINEIIEIAKNYSSNKSKVFINGILDVLQKELLNKGLIKKSGRGMIDNK